MILRVNLPSFNVTWDQPFIVLVSNCTVTAMSIQPPSTTTINYDIEVPGVIRFVPYPNVTVSPSECQQGFIYNIVEVGTSTVPSFITLGASGFQILTDDWQLPATKPQVKLEL